MRQLNKTKRRLCVGTFVLVAAPVLVASVASACTQLANLQANPNSGAAGSTINVTGSRFRTEAGAGPVEVRLDSRSGAPIATLPVGSINTVGGTITTMPVTIPAAASMGFHTLIATQFNTTTGALLSGFPVRATYRITAPAASKDSSGAPVAEATTAESAATPAAALASPAAPAAAPAASSPAATANPAAPAASTAASGNPVAATAPGAAAPGAGQGGPVNVAAAAPDSLAAGATTPPAATVTETGALSTATTPAPAITPQTVSAGLTTSAAGESASVLPTLTLSLGAAVVLLSLLAFLKSGRTILGGRRLPTLA